MSEERDMLFKLHEIIKRNRQGVQTTFSPLPNPSVFTPTQPEIQTDLGRISGVIVKSGSK